MTPELSPLDPPILSTAGGVAGLKLRRQRLLNRVDQDPSRALDDRRCHKPDFCLQYFDRCDARALECDRRALAEPDLVLRHAEIGVRLAEKTGDRHVVHRSLGVLAHAHIAVEQPEAAWSLLQEARTPAERCCSSCHADWLQRHGDYLNEIREGAHAREVLNRSLAKTDNLDLGGRTLFVRGISHHFVDGRDLALADEGSVLESLSLASPRGYFLDSVAILAVLLRGADAHYDEQALKLLDRFEARLLDAKYWTVVRTRVRWVKGQLYARLGDVRRAMERLESVRRELLETGPIRHAVAVTADLGLIYSRKIHGESLRVMKTMVGTCERHLAKSPDGPDPLLEHNLKVMAKTLRTTPELAYGGFVTLRSSFVVPVPGIIAERPGLLPSGVVPGGLVGVRPTLVGTPEICQALFYPMA